MSEPWKVDASRSSVESSGGQLLRRLSLSYLVFLALALLLGSRVSREWPLWLSYRLLVQQDLVLMIGMALSAATAVLPIWQRLRLPRIRRRALAGMAIGLLLACSFGHALVLGGYDLTRDEQMAAFDSYIFAHGRLVWTLPAEWQPDAAALNTMFMYPVDRPIAWISAYLPGNALLRAGLEHLGIASITGPLLTVGSLLALYSCARKIWPQNRQASIFAVMLLLGSGQFVITGMSSYAMSALLFFNLVWLRLYLEDRRTSDAAALLVGLFATGIHQPLFHPMFVAPFLLVMYLDRRWTRLGIFVVAYAGIGLFWLNWPGVVQPMLVGPQSSVAGPGSDYLSRLADALSANSDNLPLMAANLLRFCTWQHLLLVPLGIAGLLAFRRDRLALALGLGLALPIAMMAAILPWQGNGFGYRYLHGVIGNAVILACFGWLHVCDAVPRLRAIFIGATAATFVVLMPLQAWLSYQRYAPYAKADRRIEESKADYLLLQAGNGIAYGSLVYNRPDLSNRPIRLMAEYVHDHDALARRICRPGITIAMAGNAFFRPGAIYFGVKPGETAIARMPALRTPYARAGCRIIVLN